MASPWAVNFYGRMEWVVMNGLPFSFLDNEYNKLYTSFNPESRSLLNEISRTRGKNVEEKLTFCFQKQLVLP